MIIETVPSSSFTYNEHLEMMIISRDQLQSTKLPTLLIVDGAKYHYNADLTNIQDDDIYIYVCNDDAEDVWQIGVWEKPDWAAILGQPADPELELPY